MTFPGLYGLYVGCACIFRDTYVDPYLRKREPNDRSCLHVLRHFVVNFLLGGGRTDSFRDVGGSRGVFDFAQHEQIPIALLFEYLHDRHRLTKRPIALRETGFRRGSESSRTG